MLDGARTMFNAYQQTTAKRDSIDQVKLGLKECTQVSFIHYIRRDRHLHNLMSYIIEIMIQKYSLIKSVEISKELAIVDECIFYMNIELKIDTMEKQRKEKCRIKKGLTQS